ncbi:MAG: glycosyltransferase family 39 protein [Acidimicrobiales bacterium]
MPAPGDGPGQDQDAAGGRAGRTVRLVGGPLVVLSVVAACFLGLGLRQAWTDAPTFDEPVYLSAGVTALVHHDLRLNPEHPPLGKVLAALPVLLDHPIVPQGPAWRSSDEAAYAVSFVQAQLHAGKLRSELFLARLVPLLEAVGVAFVLYALGRRLFSRGAGLLAGVAWLADPFVLGLGHLDGVDLPLTLCTVLVSWALLEVLRQPGRRQLVVAGAACAAAVLSKDDGVLVALSAGVVAAAAGWRSVGWRVLGRPAVMAAVAWSLVWLCYLVLDPGTARHLSLLPEPFVTGLRYLGTHDTVGSPAYLLGSVWVGGKWWYWPVSMAVKVPLLTVGLLVLGPLGLRLAPRSARYETLAVAAVPGVVLTLFTVVSPKDVGLRYLLPVLALWLVVASAAALAPHRWPVQLALAAVVAVALVSTALSGPVSLVWANPPFTPAYRSVSNSDVDWGQGFWLLQAWAAGKHPWVAYFGQGLNASDIDGARSMVTDVPGVPPVVVTAPGSLTGWVAVSATSLTSNNFAQLAFLRAYCPVGVLGGSILVYRFRSPPEARPGPSVPPAACPGTYSHRVGGG